MPKLPPALSFLKRKLFFIPAGLLATYALLGFAVAPRVLRAKLPEQLGEALKRPVTIGDVSLNPFALELVVRDFKVTERGGAPFVAFRSLRVNASLFALFRGRIGFDAIALDGPHVAVTLLKDGSLSFADLLEPGDAPAAPEEPAGEPITITISELAVTDGAFTFHDLTRADPFTAELTPLSLALNDFTTETGRGSRYSFKAKLGDAQLEYDGDFSARPLKSSGRLSMKGIRLSAAQPYVASLTQYEVQGGTLGIEGRYTFDATQSPAKLVLEDSRVEVDGLKVNGAGEEQPPLEFEQLRAVASKIDVAAKEAELSELVLRRATVRARREAGGRLQLSRLSDPKVQRAAEPAAAAPTPKATTTPVPEDPSSKSWSLRLARLALEDCAVAWTDLALETPVRVKLDALKLEVAKLAWPVAGPADASFSFRWQDRGEVRVAGPVTLKPFSADLAVDVSGMGLAALDGYVRNAGFNGTLQQATLGAKLKAQVAEGGDRVAVSGTADLENVAVLDADDRPLLNLRALAVKGLDYQAAANSSLALDTLQLTGFKLKIQRKGNGDLNLEQLMRETPPARAAPAAASAPAPAQAGKKAAPSSRAVSLKALVLDDFNVDWVDETTAPSFATSLTRLSGRITNIARPAAPRPVGIKLAGRLDQAPLTINGTVLPRSDALASDVELKIEGYDLPHVTPYSVRYTAQPINAGKLSLNVVGKIAERKVTAQTRSMIDQLEFGDSVPNPGAKAKSLPLGLATAVLSDRDGRIDLELPVFGDTSDPDFEWGGLIWKTLLNVLDKVATAPFTLLAGAMNGADPEVLKLVAFSPGAAVAAGDEVKKLDTLATLLTNRPKLRLELTPGADEVADRDALAREALRRSLAVKAARAAGKALATDGGTPALAPAEYEKLVSATWLAEHAGRGDGGTPLKVEDVKFEQREADLLARQVVRREDLEALGRDRAAWCQSGLAERGIPVTRVFVVQPSKDKGARSQVDVGLR